MDLLQSGRCAVSEIPADRWPLSQFRHPRPREPGRSYTFAAGVLPDIWGFDPAVFGISPREAHRWTRNSGCCWSSPGRPRRCGLPPAKLPAPTSASMSAPRKPITRRSVATRPSPTPISRPAIRSPCLEPAFLHFRPARPEHHLRYGLLVVASRASPRERSAARRAHRDGTRRRDQRHRQSCGFVTFSQASMLSPTGLCRAFSADADGYVRAEGGVVLVLKRLEQAIADGDRFTRSSAAARSIPTAAQTGFHCRRSKVAEGAASSRL